MRTLIFALALCIACAGQVSAQDVSLETNIFAIKGADTLRLDTYIDYTLDVPVEGRPVIIYIHGGGFTMGHRINAAQEVFCRYMAGEGFIAASVDYRLAGFGFDQVTGEMSNPYNVSSTYETIKYACEDVVSATNYILENEKFRANPAQVSLAGGSAGAITTLTLVYDTCNGADYTKALPDGFNYAGAISQAGCVGSLEKELHWASKPGPIMFFHGSEDTIVPLGQTDLMGTLLVGTNVLSEQLDEMGVPRRTWIEKGADHVMAMLPCTDYLAEQATFLKEWVGGGKQASINTEYILPEPPSMASVEEMIKNVPLYILGYEKYLADIDWGNMEKPDEVVY